MMPMAFTGLIIQSLKKKGVVRYSMNTLITIYLSLFIVVNALIPVIHCLSDLTDEATNLISSLDRLKIAVKKFKAKK